MAFVKRGWLRGRAVSPLVVEDGEASAEYAGVLER
jgi:hypothetical protein